jgi:hypothetical protein
MANNTRPWLKHDPKIITNRLRDHENRKILCTNKCNYDPESISFPLSHREFVRRTREMPFGQRLQYPIISHHGIPPAIESSRTKTPLDQPKKPCPGLKSISSCKCCNVLHSVTSSSFALSHAPVSTSTYTWAVLGDAYRGLDPPKNRHQFSQPQP